MATKMIVVEKRTPKKCTSFTANGFNYTRSASTKASKR
jgi:hypothetical protein